MVPKIKPQAAPALSDLHAMLQTIDPQPTAAAINAIANHPDIKPWVAGAVVGDIDVTGLLAQGAAITLAGEHGAILFHCRYPGLYEAHTMVLPAGRGEWAVRFVQACLHWMFTRSDAMEIVTRVPQGNIRARALVRRIGGALQGRMQDGWIIQNRHVPADVYSMRVTDWLLAAPGLPERARWFVTRVQQELIRHGRESAYQFNEPVWERTTAATIEMMMAGHAVKAQVIYNRWAVISGREAVEVLTLTPTTVRVGGMTMIVRGDGFWVPSCH